MRICRWPIPLLGLWIAFAAPQARGQGRGPGSGDSRHTLAFADDRQPSPERAAKAGDREAGGALPRPWTHEDIGGVAVKGSARLSGETFRISGTLDIWGKADGFHFVHQPLDGDGQVVARVTSVENTNEHAKAGVMVRESTAADARHAAMVVTPVDGTQFLRRKEAGGLTANTNPLRNRGTLPCWVKLVRRGDTVQAFESLDGLDWVPAGTDTVPMGRKVLVGVVASSHQKDVTNTATIDHVRVEPGGGR